MLRRFCYAALAMLTIGFASISIIANPVVGQTPQKNHAWSLPPFEASISIRKESTGEVISFESVLADLSRADAVFLGETHTDESTHRAELAIYEGLLRLKDSKVVLALEMFERDVQPDLNDYLAGKVDEKEFLVQSRPWKIYREAYRPLVERAKENGLPVVASNFSASIRKQIYGKGAEGFADLSDEDRRLIPSDFFPNNESYWKRVDNVTRSHQGFMEEAKSESQRLYSTQSLWDNSMGDACAAALEKHPEHLVLHINGGFHSAYGDGTVHQFKLRKPDASVKTVAIVSDLNPSTAQASGIPNADYLFIVESRASNLHEGERSVQIGQSLNYRFHLPAIATEDSPVPLLIWLCDEGLTAKESMALCKERFGKLAAIAVIDPPYKAIGEDLAVGGRWYWPDSFSGDTGSMVEGIERIWAYLSRHYPIDSSAVCVVGEGSGATVAAVVAIHTERLSLNAIAISPKRYAKIRDVPLLLPEHYGDDPLPKRLLQIIGNAKIKNGWQSELEQYNKVGVTSTFVLAAADPWEEEQQTSTAIRAALGLPEESVNSASSDEDKKQYLLIDSNSSRARHWGQLQARKISKRDEVHAVVVSERPKDKNVAEVSTIISPTAASAAGVLPRCPGAFGGTTVVVLPCDLDAEKAHEWLAIEANDPLAAASRFYRVRIAMNSNARTLPQILEKLLSKNRKNILIVPAEFYADLTWLRELRDSAQEFENQMTIHWLPGLGGLPGILSQ